MGVVRIGRAIIIVKVGVILEIVLECSTVFAVTLSLGIWIIIGPVILISMSINMSAMVTAIKMSISIVVVIVVIAAIIVIKLSIVIVAVVVIGRMSIATVSCFCVFFWELCCIYFQSVRVLRYLHP